MDSIHCTVWYVFKKSDLVNNVLVRSTGENVQTLFALPTYFSFVPVPVFKFTLFRKICCKNMVVNRYHMVFYQGCGSGSAWIRIQEGRFVN